jgi:hypothetical protein
LRKLSFAVVVGFLALAAGTANAQQFDLGFGVGTVIAPSANFASTFSGSTQTLTGGAYPVFSGDFLLKKNLGVQGEIAWRASRNLYLGYQPFRPLFFDFNGIYVPDLGKHISPEFTAGIGAESVRFYTNFFNCSYFGGCTNYVSSNHFMGHFGAGIRFYPHGNFFIRPGVDLYLVHNNVEFSSGHFERVGVSIGYTFGGRLR